MSAPSGMGEDRAHPVLTERSPPCHDCVGPRELPCEGSDSWTSFHRPEELPIVMPHPFPRAVPADPPADLPAVLEELSDSDPALAQAFVRALRDAESPALRAAATHVGHALARNSCLDGDVDAV